MDKKETDPTKEVEITLVKIKATYKGTHRIGAVLYTFEKGNTIEVPKEYATSVRAMFKR